MEYKRHIQRNHQYLDFPDSGEEEAFMIVFDVSSLKEEELAIEFPEENKMKVSLKHEFRETGDITFSRDCMYVYMLPDYVQRANLVAYWSEDDFLVIKHQKTKETKIPSESSEKPDGYEFKSDGIINFSPVDNKNGEKVQQETTSCEKNIIPEKLSKCSSSESEEMLMEEMKSLNVSSKSWEKAIQDRKSTSISSEIDEKTQESKLIDHTNSVQVIPRLVPERVHNQFNLMLTESDLQAAMNDIEKRMNFVNEFIDKHTFDSHH